MAESAVIRGRNIGPTDRITYRNIRGGAGANTVTVRRNRTEAETRAQFDRIYDQLERNPNEARTERFANTYVRTMRALDATGRSIRGMDNYGRAVLVRRRNNRRTR